MNRIVPQLNVLTKENIEQVHQYSLDILANTGFNVESEETRDIFLKSDGVTLKNEKILLSRDLVEWSIEKAPANISIHRPSPSRRPCS